MWLENLSIQTHNYSRLSINRWSLLFLQTFDCLFLIVFRVFDTIIVASAAASGQLFYPRCSSNLSAQCEMSWWMKKFVREYHFRHSAAVMYTGSRGHLRIRGVGGISEYEESGTSLNTGSRGHLRMRSGVCRLVHVGWNAYSKANYRPLTFRWLTLLVLR